MLVNCPKCGLSQPKDKYCAACGIDMDTYKPKQVPFLKRMLNNIGVQITGLVVVIFGAYAFIKADSIGQYFGLGTSSTGSHFFFVSSSNDKLLSNKKLASNQDSPEDQSSSAADSENRDPNTDSDLNNKDNEPTFLESTTTTLASLMGINAEKGSSENASSPDSSTDSLSATKTDKNMPPLWINESKIPNNSNAMQVDFVELSKEDLNKLWTGSSANRQSHKMDKLFVVITSFEKIKDFKPLQRFQSILRINEPRLQKDFFIRNNNSANLPLGLSMDLSYSIDEFQPRLTVNGLIEEHLKDYTMEHPFTLEADTKDIIVISGPLPASIAKTIYRNQEELVNIPTSHPFLIFKSKSYQNEQSQFTILLQFSKN